MSNQFRHNLTLGSLHHMKSGMEIKSSTRVELCMGIKEERRG